MSHAVLIVDDEESVLRAMKRLLRRDGYEIHLAASGPAALEILAEKEIAVIICDQRMPGMTGAEVLAESVKLRPDAFRITVTGYADLQALQASVNEGGIHRFLLKPWNDDQLRKAVQDGVRAYQLIQENRRLEALTRKQKAQLEAWNRQLEEQVRQRTEELRVQNEHLRNLQERLAQSLRDTVAVLAGMLEAYNPSLGIHSKRVARLARDLGARLQLDESQLRDVEFAAYLHDIGKISKLYSGGQPTLRPSGKRRADPSLRHPEAGYAILSRVGGFENIAQAVRHQQERYDGTGHPDGLKEENIPLASRIIAVTNAYDKAVFRASEPTKILRTDGRRVLLEGMGKRFDPALVRLLLEYLDEIGVEVTGDAEVELSPKQIKAGMVLSRPLYNAENVLLLKAGTRLTEELVERLRTLSLVDPVLTSVFVKCMPQTDDDGGSQQSQASQESTSQQPQRPAAESAGNTDAKPTVLVVDDTQFVCNALSRELRRAGFQTVSADSGSAALKIVAEGRVDLVLTDLLMPGMSGGELIERLRQCAPDLPCIIMTANATKENVLQVAKAPNVKGILVKPWDRERLIAAVESAIACRRAQPAASNA